ncbi:MAG: hypothetical protein R2762_08225 [Bryobacteraceae bacterium]
MPSEWARVPGGDVDRVEPWTALEGAGAIQHVVDRGADASGVDDEGSLIAEVGGVEQFADVVDGVGIGRIERDSFEVANPVTNLGDALEGGGVTAILRRTPMNSTMARAV